MNRLFIRPSDVIKPNHLPLAADLFLTTSTMKGIFTFSLLLPIIQATLSTATTGTNPNPTCKSAHSLARMITIA